MKKKKPVSTQMVIAIGLIGLVFFGLAVAMLSSPNNTSDVSTWFKTTFFPADEYATVSLFDAEDISSQSYRGSTSSAWVLSGVVSAVIILICTIFFARERGLI